MATVRPMATARRLTPDGRFSPAMGSGPTLGRQSSRAMARALMLVRSGPATASGTTPGRWSSPATVRPAATRTATASPHPPGTVMVRATARPVATARRRATARPRATAPDTGPPTATALARATVTATARPTATVLARVTALPQATVPLAAMALVPAMVRPTATAPATAPATGRAPGTGLVPATGRLAVTLLVPATGRLTAKARLPATGGLTATGPRRATGRLTGTAGPGGTVRHPPMVLMSTARRPALVRAQVTDPPATARVTASGQPRDLAWLTPGRPGPHAVVTDSARPATPAMAAATAPGRLAATGPVLVPGGEMDWSLPDDMARRPIPAAPAGLRLVTAANSDAITGDLRAATVPPGKGRRLATARMPGTVHRRATTVRGNASGQHHLALTGTTRMAGPSGTFLVTGRTGRVTGRRAATGRRVLTGRAGTSRAAMTGLSPVRSGRDLVRCRRPGEEHLASLGRAVRRPQSGETVALLTMTATVSGPVSSRTPAVPPGPPDRRQGTEVAERSHPATVLTAAMVPTVAGIRTRALAIRLAFRPRRPRGTSAIAVNLAPGRCQVTAAPDRLTEPANPGGRLRCGSPACGRPRCRRGRRPPGLRKRRVSRPARRIQRS